MIESPIGKFLEAIENGESFPLVRRVGNFFPLVRVAVLTVLRGKALNENTTVPVDVTRTDSYLALPPGQTASANI